MFIFSKQVKRLYIDNVYIDGLLLKSDRLEKLQKKQAGVKIGNCNYYNGFTCGYFISFIEN